MYHHFTPHHFSPREYLELRGNIKKCWEIHKARMIELGLPYVEYAAFNARVKKYGWDLYKAIHTPCDYSKLEWHEKLHTWTRTQWLKFKSLFKRHDRGGRGKRHEYSC